MKKIVIGSLLVIMMFSLASCGEKNTKDSNAEAVVAETAKGYFGDLKIMPEFQLNDINDKPVTDEILKEKDITVINIWGTFCKPCIDELPILQELSQEYGSRGVNILGIVADGDVNNIGAFEMLDKLEVKFTNLIPTEEFKKDFLNRVNVAPVTVIVNSKGEILETLVGDRTKEEYTDLIEQYLN